VPEKSWSEPTKYRFSVAMIASMPSRDAPAVRLRKSCNLRKWHRRFVVKRMDDLHDEPARHTPPAFGDARRLTAAFDAPRGYYSGNIWATSQRRH